MLYFKYIDIYISLFLHATPILLLPRRALDDDINAFRY